MSVTINGTSGVVFNDSSTQNTAATGFGFKNRIINGAMMISQRNGTSSVTPASGAYVIDRFQQTQSTASSLSYQQVAPPTALAGFVYCQKATVLAARTPAAADRYDYLQAIEGLNIMDLAWGTANAKSIAVSFWVYSSVTGTFAFSVVNGSVNRSYVSTYTISSANTWTQVTATIAGDTSGTWATDNSAALLLCFDLGCGSNSETTAGAWQAGFYERTSACVKLVNTLSATFYITGVQLEKGSTATSFDYRPYGTELALCQRYYIVFAWESGSNWPSLGGYITNGGTVDASFTFPVQMRTTPTTTKNGTWNISGNNGQPTVLGTTSSGFALRITGTAAGQGYAYGQNATNTVTNSAEL